MANTHDFTPCNSAIRKSRLDQALKNRQFPIKPANKDGIGWPVTQQALTVATPVTDKRTIQSVLYHGIKVNQDNLAIVPQQIARFQITVGNPLGTQRAEKIADSRSLPRSRLSRRLRPGQCSVTRKARPRRGPSRSSTRASGCGVAMP